VNKMSGLGWDFEHAWIVERLHATTLLRLEVLQSKSNTGPVHDGLVAAPPGLGQLSEL
jgi:hypothetical protein